jgi:hypothetical protein
MLTWSERFAASTRQLKTEIANRRTNQPAQITDDSAEPDPEPEPKPEPEMPLVKDKLASLLAGADQFSMDLEECLEVHKHVGRVGTGITKEDWQQTRCCLEALRTRITSVLGEMTERRLGLMES